MSILTIPGSEFRTKSIPKRSQKDRQTLNNRNRFFSFTVTHLFLLSQPGPFLSIPFPSLIIQFPKRMRPRQFGPVWAPEPKTEMKAPKCNYHPPLSLAVSAHHRAQVFQVQRHSSDRQRLSVVSFWSTSWTIHPNPTNSASTLNSLIASDGKRTEEQKRRRWKRLIELDFPNWYRAPLPFYSPRSI